MVDLTVDASCRRHLGVPAVGGCRRCDKAFCAACRVESIATESAYCSAECREAALRHDHGTGISDDALLAGYRAPFRTGSGTWLRAFGGLNAGIAPLSILAAFLPVLLGGFQSGGPGLNGRLTVALIAVAVFGAAAVSIVISRIHTAHAGGVRSTGCISGSRTNTTMTRPSSGQCRRGFAEDGTFLRRRVHYVDRAG